MRPIRRDFLKTFCAASFSSLAAPTLLSRRNTGSSLEPLRFGVVGIKGRGNNLISAIKASNSAKLVAVADVDQKVLESREKDDSTLFRSDDFRKLLDRKDIDAIASATPNHWHAMVTIMATLAGKHVYIEKPISHNMYESDAIVSTAEKTGKLVQCGFQNRSDSAITGFFSRLHRGEFGTVKFVHGTCHRPRKSIGKVKAPTEIPRHINYELWLGPAKDLPIMRPSLHYDWHWDFNTGNGDVGNQGPHEWDMMNWAMGDPDVLPDSILSAGNRFGWNDAGNTPNVMACSGTRNSIPFCFEVMDLIPGDKPAHGRGVGVIIETEKGRFIGGRGGGKFVFTDGKTEDFQRTKGQDPTNDHMQNFIDCVLSNDRSKLNSDCRIAAKSSSMAHMANISYQLAITPNPEELESRFSGTSEEKDLLDRMINSTKIYAQKHNLVELAPWKLGPRIEFDNEQNKFAGQFAGLANQKMTRDYRAEFSLPKLIT